VKAPAYIPATKEEGPLIWDLGFFSNGSLTETNYLTCEGNPTPDHHVSFYLKLAVYLKNRKTQDFKTVLGFDDLGSQYRLGDLWLDEATFTANLRQLLG